jgi:hypothetical protein
MFCLVDTGFERFKRIALENGNDLSGENRSVIDAFVRDEVNHYASVFNLTALVCFESTFNGVSTGEHSGEGGVEIDNVVRERGKKERGKKAHPAG